MAPLSPDEAQLGELVKTLDLDRTGYSVLVAAGLELCASRDFRRLHVALSYAPKQHWPARRERAPQAQGTD